LKILLTTLSLSLLLFAESKIENLSANKTVKKSEREAVVSLARLGMSGYSYNLSVLFCPLPPKGKEQKCFPEKSWKGSFSQNEFDKLFATDLNQLVSKRYDIIKFVGSRAFISTATGDLSANIHKTASFPFTKGSEEKFQKRTLEYLNNSSLEKILSLSTDTRYSEMREVEKMSFLRTKGKENGIPFEVAEKLVNSAYAFSLYYGKIEGSVKIVEEEFEIHGQKMTRFIVTFDIPADMTLFVNKFDGNNFSLYKKVETNRSNSIMGQFSPSMIKQTGEKPTNRDSKELLTSVFSDLFKENIIALNTKLKEDRNFKIVAPIENIDGSSLEIAMGCQEDIRVDHPFKVIRNKNGDEVELGFFKVRKSGKNCLLMPEEDRENSVASAIKGSFEPFDLALEHPWTGVFATISAGTDLTKFSSNDIDLDGGEFKYTQIGLKADLGYVLNSSALSEVWLDIFGQFGIQKDMNNTQTLGASEITGAGAYGGGLEIAKRLNLFGGIYTDLGFGAGYRIYKYDYTPLNSINSHDLEIKYAYADPFAKFGYNFSPNIEIFGKVGYTIPFGVDHSLKYDGEEIIDSPYFENGIDADGNLNLSFGMAFHTSFASIFSKIFSNPPSEVCEEMK
jgi:hypothetical protein